MNFPNLDEFLGVVFGVILSFVALVVVMRGVRTVVDGRKARRERRLRPQLLALVAAEDERSAPPIHLRHRDLAEIADLAGPLLRKVRGEAHNRLAVQLRWRGVVDIERRRMNSVSGVRRARAAAFLGAVGDEGSVSRLATALTDRNPDVRITAARALGRIGQADAAPLLLDALAGEPGAEDAVPSGTIVAALQALGSAGIPACLDAAVHARASRQAMAIETLGLLGSMDAIDGLIDLLVINPYTEREVRTRAARALGRIGSPRAVMYLASVLEGDEPWPLRAVSARALGDIGAADAVDALWDLMYDPEPAVVVNVARALATAPEGRARLARLAATAPPPGIIADEDREAHQPAMAAAEALAVAGEPVDRAPAPEPETPTVDLRHHPEPSGVPGELTLRSPSPAERTP